MNWLDFFRDPPRTSSGGSRRKERRSDGESHPPRKKVGGRKRGKLYMRMLEIRDQAIRSQTDS